MPAEKIKKRISKTLDIPEDVIFDIPKITMNGNNEIFCEGFRAIKEYSTSLISLDTTVGKLCIEGFNLLISNITANEITISGRIKTVSFI